MGSEKRRLESGNRSGLCSIPSWIYGESVTLYDNRFELSLPMEEKMIKELRGTCHSIEEVEGYPDGNMSCGGWKKFVRTVQYKKWVEETNEMIKSKCHFLTTKEEVEKLIGKK